MLPSHAIHLPQVGSHDLILVEGKPWGKTSNEINHMKFIFKKEFWVLLLAHGANQEQIDEKQNVFQRKCQKKMSLEYKDTITVES